ncbi:MAG TPA: family 78 glycoside hydrolase catalytic domain [Draconibacterium sp.]|nr:family 78 glycoside hydrolase catalytic domain [Draconibacterium sp.]
MNYSKLHFIKLTIFSGIVILASLACKESGNEIEIVNLKCEYLVNPIGIDASAPRFVWQISCDETGFNQSAYEIIVGTDSLEIAMGNGNQWNSGKIASGYSLAVYAGNSLNPFTKYFWSVKIWDENDVLSKWSKIACFETGMMDSKNWRGDWISDTRDIHLKSAPWFRKEFTASKTIQSAKVYIAVGGLYELYLNGKKVGNHRLDPMYTRFDRRTLYVTHDITELITEGKNAVGVLLGNGWYNHQSTAVWYFHEAPWRARPKFCIDLHITYSDSTKEIVSSGIDWKTALSDVVFNSIYTAEHQDARLIQEGWNSSGFDDSGWKNAIPVSAPSNNIVAQNLHPVRNVEEIPAVNMVKFSNKNYLFDFGRNISGVTRLKITGDPGTEVRLIHAERLKENGKADLSNIDVHYRPTDDKDPFATDIYYLSGKEDEFMPHFNYKGFQYVEVVSSKPIELTKESLTAYFMHSDLPVAGYIHSSNPTLNKIWEATNNSYLSNLFGYPTDCPQREKNGWTGDGQIAIETGLYNFDGITVYEKWLADHRDEQQPNGVLPAIIPTSGWGYTWANGPDWTSTIAIIPWNIYLFYGDSRLLEQCYENIKKYVDHINAESPDGLTDWGLGDWVPVKSKSPKEFTSSVYYYTDVTILAKAAQLFGHQKDFEKYTALADKIKKAINQKYLNAATGIYGSGLQTELSVALYWGIVPDSLKGKVAKNLADRVIQDDKHIDVGLLGTKAILNALSENGYAGLASEVALQETYPSWGWWIKNGATTLYENWDIDSESDISLNHIMFGEIGAWFYKGIGGIFPDPENPGFKNVILKPNFIPSLDHFEASHDGPYGKISSKWEKAGENLIYTVSVPPNSTATLFLLSDSILEREKIAKTNGVKSMESSEIFTKIKLKSGNYTFNIH